MLHTVKLKQVTADFLQQGQTKMFTTVPGLPCSSINTDGCPTARLQLPDKTWHFS